jgi:adenylate cyclase
MAKLEIQQGGEVVREVALAKSPFLIGRALESDLALMDHLVSRKHAEIARDQATGRWRIVDLGSSNGIYVNETRVPDALLHESDSLRIGSSQMTFRDDAALAPRRLARAPASAGSLSVTLAPTLDADPGLSVIKSVSELRADYAASQAGPAAGVLALFRERRRPTPTTPVPRDAKEGLHFFILYQLAQAVNSATSLEELFDRTIDMLCEALDASCGAVLTIDRASGELTQRATRERRPRGNITPGGRPRELALSQTIVKKVIGEKVAILTRDALADDRFKAGKSVAAMQIRSAISVPIWDHEQVEGLIYLDSSHAANVFTEDDQDLVTAVGHQLAVAMKREEMTAQLKAEAVVRSNLERYHSPDVVEMILRQEGEIGLEVKEADVSVLFADIEGFTKMSEHMAPAEVARLLNGYFEGATAAIFRHRGQVNKYIGDAIFAVFGAPIANPDHAAAACGAAVEMLSALREFRRTLPPEAQFRLRIGINSGPVVAGNIGAPQRLEYTVIGNTVNVAARLEKVAPPDAIAIGPAVEAQIRGRLATTSLGPFSLKGIEHDIEVFQLVT